MNNLNPATIAVVGAKKSGKTTTAESIVRELAKRGYKVAAVKHVSEPDFTIDTPGKDTWRFAQAGAKTIVSVAANEIATIEKAPLEKTNLKTILQKCRGNDIIVVEGFKKTVAKTRNIAKVVVTKSEDEVKNAVAAYVPILAFSGPYSTKNLFPEIPYVDGVADIEKLADIIEKKILKK